jgi:hypothetical protein
MCHIYLETESEAALESWDAWAEENGISPEMRAFAQYRKDVWNGPKEPEMIEMGKVTKRTWENADLLHRTSKEVKFKTSDILRAVINGCVGSEGGNEFLGWLKIWENAPKEEDILADPENCPLPKTLDVTFALSLFLARKAKEDSKKATPFVKYSSRWNREQESFFMRNLAKTLPEVVTLKEYQSWESRQES